MYNIVILLLAGLLGKVAAHGGTYNYTVGDVWYRGYEPSTPTIEQDGKPWLVQRKWISIDPIFQPDNVSLVCNYPGTPAPGFIPINAGDNITAVYYYWLHTVGPMILWMADCGASCHTFDPTKGDWFKLEERGLLSGTISEGTWGQREFQHWDGTPDLWTTTIPKNLKPGNYILRHEMIALHIENKPQFYPQCAHVKVSGKGKAVPGKEYTAKIPGVWSMKQPEININVYSKAVANLTTYVIPGPPVWTGEGTAKAETWLERLLNGFKGP